MPESATSKKFLNLVRHPLKFRMFLFLKLPAAFFSGLRIINADDSNCSVSVPFKWLTQNPFKSTYFASLSMAAEMSTGALGLMHVYKKTPPVSMLITNMQANYFKKATGKTIFLCDEGKKIADTIEDAIKTKEPKNITVRSVGKNADGELIAEFIFTWSFKPKQV